jgi:hypothetical protein
VCVLALAIQLAMRVRCVVIFGHPGWLYNILPHYLINGMIFGKKLLNIIFFFLVSLQRFSEILLILR